jgi:hypothetical protein
MQAFGNPRVSSKADAGTNFMNRRNTVLPEADAAQAWFDENDAEAAG